MTLRSQCFQFCDRSFFLFVCLHNCSFVALFASCVAALCALVRLSEPAFVFLLFRLPALVPALARSSRKDHDRESSPEYEIPGRKGRLVFQMLFCFAHDQQGFDGYNLSAWLQ